MRSRRICTNCRPRISERVQQALRLKNSVSLNLFTIANRREYLAYLTCSGDALALCA